VSTPTASSEIDSRSLASVLGAVAFTMLAIRAPAYLERTTRQG
jgi:hypothetical protein